MQRSPLVVLDLLKYGCTQVPKKALAPTLKAPAAPAHVDRFPGSCPEYRQGFNLP